LIDPDDFVPPPGMPVCPPADPVKAAIPPGAPAPPHDAPVCVLNRVDIDAILFGLSAPSMVPLASERVLSNATAAGGFLYVGSGDDSFEYAGGSMLAEVSDPSICCVAHHFDPHIATHTPVNNYIEVGWVESNHGPLSPAVRKWS